MTRNIDLAVLASVSLAVPSVVQHLVVGDTTARRPGGKLSGGQLRDARGVG